MDAMPSGRGGTGRRPRRGHPPTGLVLLTLAIALATPLAVVPSSATAESCVASTTTLHADADAWIDENSPTNNGGTDAVLAVRSGTPQKNARTFIRFALPPAPPEGCVVASAHLRMFSPSSDEGSRMSVERVAVPWEEGRINWQDQPGTIGDAASAWGGEGYLQWSVADQVQAMFEDGNHGFRVRSETESAEAGSENDLHAREKGETPPVLVIRFDAPPESGPPPPPAAPVPTPLECGALVTSSVLLTADVSNCPGDGLVVGADRVVIDLGGHTLDGVGLATGVRNPGHDGVVVRNGAVQDFDHGVALEPGSDLNLVEGLALHDNQLTGVLLVDAGSPAAGNVVRDNDVERNGDGIALVKGTSDSVVSGNRMAGNGGPGLFVGQSEGNTLEGNVVESSGDLGVGLEGASRNIVRGNTVSGNSDGGIEVRAGSHANVIDGNHVTSSGDTGILVAESDDNLVVANVAHQMSDSGIVLDVVTGTTVRGNDVRHNPGGIQLDGSTDNLVEANVASSSTGIGIELGSGALRNEVRGNTADGNGGTGIHVSEEAPPGEGNLLTHNSATGNTGDGITTAKPGHTLAWNSAHENGGWGILAAAGTLDAGGNQALRNGDAAQCSGIPCNGAEAPDETPPETDIEDGPDDVTNQTVAAVSFTGTDDRTPAADLRYECSLDGALFEACTDPATVGPLAEGAHTLAVRAVDAAGNVDPTPAVERWRVDTTPPSATITSAPPGQSGSAAATFRFTSSEPATVACSLDGGPPTACTSPRSYTGLASGAHSFAVTPTDAAGNTGAAATYTWTVVLPVPCPTTTVTLTAVADTWVGQAASGTAYGGEALLRVESRRSANARALVRFDLPALGAGCRVVDARLQLDITSTSPNRTLQAIRVSGSWSESTVTWRTQPSTSGTAALATSGGSTTDWSVTSQMRSMYVTGNRGFLVRDRSESAASALQAFQSRESGAEHAPRLVVTIGP